MNKMLLAIDQIMDWRTSVVFVARPKFKKPVFINCS